MHIAEICYWLLWRSAVSETPNKIKLFESQQIRTEWDADAEKWWFSALDVVAALTDQPDYTKTRNYWKWLKRPAVWPSPMPPKKWRIFVQRARNET